MSMSSNDAPSPFVRRLILLMPGFIRRRVEQRYNFQQTVVNVGWLFFDKGLRMGVGIIVTAWIARFLGPEQYGIWNYAIAFAALFSTLATLGLDGIVVREVVTSPESKYAILGSAFLLRLAGGVLALFALSTLMLALKPGNVLLHYLLVLTAGAFLFQPFEVIDLYFQSRVLSKHSILAKDTAFVIVTLLRIGLIVSSASLLAFAGAALLEVALGAAFLIIAYAIHGESIRRWMARTSVAMKLVRDSWPLVFSGLVVMIYMRIDQIMIGEMIGEREVGLYSAAVRLSELWYFVPMAIAGSMFPRIVELRMSDMKQYTRRMQQMYDFLTWSSVAGALLLSFFAGPLINMLYGRQYVGAAGVLSIHAWTGVFVSLGVASGKHLLAENLTVIAFYRSASGAIVNVLANLLLIPRYGVIGAAFSTLFSQMLAAYGFDIVKTPTRHMFLMKTRSIFFLNAFKLVHHRNV
jgi:PST family polysaccharide transporter